VRRREGSASPVDVPSFTVLLASASPRRREILQALGHRVLVRPCVVDEDERPGEVPADYLARVVQHKLEAGRALAASVTEPFDALLVADTMVELDSRILHKPIDRDDGRRMLRALSGRAHVVTTRFALWAPSRAGASSSSSRPSHVESVSTTVVFRALGDDEIDEYLRDGEGADKAGGYAVQGRASAFVVRLAGSYGAVVGLPAAEVQVALLALVG
jgi:septum formation protein